MPDWTVVHRDPNLRRLWWQGIPTKLRAPMWQAAAGNALALSKGASTACPWRDQGAYTLGCRRLQDMFVKSEEGAGVWFVSNDGARSAGGRHSDNTSCYISLFPREGTTISRPARHAVRMGSSALGRGPWLCSRCSEDRRDGSAQHAARTRLRCPAECARATLSEVVLRRNGLEG